MDKELFSLLNSKPQINIATLGFFENFPVEEYFIEGNSALIYGNSDSYWAHISSSSKKELSVLLAKHHSKARFYFSIEDWMIPPLLIHGQEDWIMPTNRYILHEKVATKKPKLPIDKINKIHASFIHKNSDYKKYTPLEYIEQRLNKDISAGITINNQLVAWGFTHDDGALGFLHVLDQHRKKGYAMDVVLALIQQKRKVNKPIFCNIVPENIVAINFVSKLGFQFDRKVSWLKLK